MKVLHVIPSVSSTKGGPSFAIEAMTRHLAQAGVEVEIATTDDDGLDAHLNVSLEQPIMRDGVTIRYFRRQTRLYTISRPLAHWLELHVSDYDLLHVHALFSYTSVIAGVTAKRHKVPYIVRPLGVLNQWGMKNRRQALKRLSFRLIEKRVLDNAALIHYTSQQEKTEALKLGVHGSSFVLPLGLDLSVFECLPDKSELLEKYPALKGRCVILFLSRIDPIKGLDLLFPAFEQVHRSHPEAILLIVGSGEQSFEDSLREQVDVLGISSHVIWTGFLDGRNKLAVLAAADVFVLPSYSENFGVAAVEAMAAGVPVVISNKVGIAHDVERFQAGMVVSLDDTKLSQAIEDLLDDSALRDALGERGQHFVRDHLSSAQVTTQLVKVYKNIMESTPYASTQNVKAVENKYSKASTNKASTTPCPVCGGTRFARRLINSSLRLQRCQNCSFVLRDAERPLQELFENVEEEFFSEGYLRRRDLFSDKFFLNKARQRLRDISRFQPSGKLLDLGCGTGEMLPVAKDMGYSAEGLDCSTALVDYVRKKYNLPVHLGDPTSVDLPHQYDVVVMAHVIEHVIDPLDTLKHTARLLESNGLLYIATPNIDCYEASFRGWGSYEPYHLWYFNPKTIRIVLEKAGYEVLDVHTWDPYSAWFNTMFRSYFRRPHEQTRSMVHGDTEERLRYPFLAAMAALNVARFSTGAVLTPLRNWQERTDTGEELIALARKV